MAEVVIQMTNVTKGFPDQNVLQELNLTVHRGTVTGLLGRNGAGKTTLLKCALGLQSPQAGICQLLGEPARHLSGAAKARIGYAPQEISLYGWMKVRQLVAYTKAFYPRWNDSLTDRLLSKWQLDREKRVGTLSTGQMQSLAIVLAMGHEPDLLILDEPVASLDPTARRQFLASLLEVANSGERTIVLSTHITSDLERVADQIALLQSGRITFHDELSTLKDSVKRLRIHRAAGLPDGLEEIPGLMRCEANGRSAVLTVRGYRPG
ncbi:MAG: ABC transporter ATP-binding protein, partial [Planctomycetaceae bacterium]|nr:ABC transporter ATP-binding protein [Planctomycetaceae bacterium]